MIPNTKAFKSDAIKGIYSPSLIICYFLDIFGRRLPKQHSIVLVFFFSFRPSLPGFSHRVSNSSGVSCASSHPSSALPDHAPHLPSLSSGPPHYTTASLGRRGLPLWLLVARWRLPLSRIFRPPSPVLLLRSFPGPLSLSPLTFICPRHLSRLSLPSLVPCSIIPSVPHRRTGAGSCARSCWLSAGAPSCLYYI